MNRSSYTKVDFPGKAFNQLLGQNDVGQAVGYYSTAKDGSAPDHIKLVHSCFAASALR